MKNPLKLLQCRAIKIVLTMKVFLLICVLNVAAAVHSMAQVNITINLEEANIESALSQIERETNLFFFYKSEELSRLGRITHNFKNEPISQVLDRLLLKSGLTYKIIDEYIAILPENIGNKDAQQIKTISGIVKDSSGEPMPGVSVVIKSRPNVGVLTDSDGRFTINAEIGEILQFSFIGMKNIEVLLRSAEILNVEMEEEIIGLDDVIVVAYGTIKRESYTGSASVVSAEKINERPLSSFSEALQYNSTGLIVNTSGMPGAMPTIRVRGVGSMNASNDPLYVIDGIPSDMSEISQLSNITSDPMTSLNPNDIESITVLKDAAAASLYGSRAANGVIIITTKQGKEGKTKFELDAIHGISELSYFPDVCNKDEYVNIWVTSELHSIMRAKAISDGVDPYQHILESYNDPVLYETYLATARSRFNNAFKIEGNQYDFWGDGYNMYPDTDWRNEVSKIGKTDKINFSASGGYRRLTYFASGEYYDIQSPIKGASLRRYSGRSNLTTKVNDLFWFGVNINLSYTDQSGPQTGAMYANPVRTAAYLPPVIPVYNSDGSFNASFPYNVLSSYNPVAIIDAADFETITHRQISSAWAQFNITDDLFFKTTFGYDVRQIDEGRWYPPGIASGKATNGGKFEYFSNRRRVTSSNIINYAKSFGSKNNINLLGGYEIEHTHTKYFGGEAANYQTSFTPELTAGSVIQALSGSKTDDALMSFIGKAEYNFDHRFYAAFSYRRDGSSRFSRESRWGNFYSVSTAWRVSKEKFLEDLKWISDAKIRFSYGVNGTLPNGLYDYIGNYVFGQDYNGLSGASVTNVENLNLSWERSKNTNFGIDLGLWDGRIFLIADYFDRFSDGLLLDRELSRVSGYTTATVNLGSMRNRGFEFTLNSTPIETRSFSWDISFNLSTLLNTIENLPTDNVTAQQIDRQGYTQQSWYLPEWAGIDKATGEPMWYHVDGASGERTLTKSIDDATRQIFGNSMPHYYGSVNSLLKYRNFDLSLLLSYALDFNVLDYDGALNTQDDGYSRQRNKERVLLDNWRPDNTNSENPILMAGLRNGSNYSTRYIYKGDYLKLKNLRLGYTIDTKLSNRLGMEGIKMYVQAENLFIKTHMPNFDPELADNGKRYLYDYPPSRTIMVGFNLKF